MATHFSITVRFLAGRYHGASWPPHPATLFQALVSGGHTGAASNDWGDREKEALHWLERLPPPSISARHAEVAHSYRLFVPNNNLDKAVQSEVAGGKTIVKPETLRAAKDVHPRSFPGHVPGEAGIIYAWPVPEEEFPAAHSHASSLDRLAARLGALGWGIDFAAAQAAVADDASPMPPESHGWTHYIPAKNGEMTLEVPAPGVLDNLDRRYAAFRGRISGDGLNPTMPAAGFLEVHYRNKEVPLSRSVLALDLYKDHHKPLAKAWAKAMHVAGWIRHAASRALQQEAFSDETVKSFVLGHTGAADPGRRLSYLPLPSIGARHADGAIRRALIAAPSGLQREESEALSLLRIKLPGSLILGEREEEPLGYFAEPEDRKTVYPFYQATAAVWETVTPVVLQGHNAVRRQISIEKTERLLLQSLQSAGYPPETIAGLTYQPAPFWPGAKAAASMLTPGHLQRWPRLHVRVVFKRPVTGPVAIGLGRHYGIGLLAARS